MGIHNYKFLPPKRGWPEFDEEGKIINENDEEVGAPGPEAPEEETRDADGKPERVRHRTPPAEAGARTDEKKKGT